MRRIPLILAVMCLAAAVDPAVCRAGDVSVAASIEPPVVPVGGEARLVVTITGKFSKSSEPELPSLDGFQVYEAGTSQNFSFVNGSISSSLQFTYVLVPQREGSYSIEPIRFRIGDKYYTAEPVRIDVVKSAGQVSPPGPAADDEEVGADLAGKNIFIRGSVDRDTVYVNQQVTWTLGFYTDGRVDLLRSPNYTPPASEGFWVEDLPPQRKYYSRIGGKEYLVNEIKRAYFPTAPGEYTVGQARVDLVVDDFGPSRIDDFFNRRLRSFGFGRPVALNSEEIGITVLPLPAQGKPAGFSGIVARDLRLSMAADKQVVQVGEPVNVTVELVGSGNIKTAAPPELSALTGFKVYESGSSSDVFKTDYVVSGRKKYEYVVVPTSEGGREIPPLKIHYFDPAKRTYMTAKSARIELSVKPGTSEDGRRIIYAGSSDEIEVLGHDINHIHPVPATVSTGGVGIYRSRLYLALHALPLLAVFASLAVDRRRRRWMDQGPRARAARALGEAERKFAEGLRLVKKGKHADSFSVVSAALHGYFADKMNVASSGLTWQAIEDFLRTKGASDEDMAELGSMFRRCDAVQYSPASAEEGEAKETISRAAGLVKRLEKRYRG